MLRACLSVWRQRQFSTSTMVDHSWRYRGREWEVQSTLISPVIPSPIKGTIILLPSMTLLSSKEEWRACAEYLADLGYRCIITDWPGWSQRNGPMNWALQVDVSKGENSAWIFTDFTCSLIAHASQTYTDSPVSVVAAGGVPTVHCIKALHHLSKTATISLPSSVISFSPTWKYYLTRYCPEGYPKKLERRRMFSNWVANTLLIRSRTMFKLYISKFMLAKFTRRLYEDKIQHDTVRCNSKKEVLMRDRPLQIDLSLALGNLDPIGDTQEFIQTILSTSSGRESPTTKEEQNDDSDDDDALLNIRVPEWTKKLMVSDMGTNVDSVPRNNILLKLVIPEDAVERDKSDMELLQKWVGGEENINIGTIPGRIACHEESPALSATIIDDFLSGIVQ